MSSYITTEEGFAEFLAWFRLVYGRGWLDIKTEAQDAESINAKRAWDSAVTWTQCELSRRSRDG